MEKRSETSGIGLPGDLRLFLGILLALNALCIGVEVMCRKVTTLRLNRDPYIFPLMREHYPDYLFFEPRFDFFHTMQFFSVNRGSHFMYPAPVGVIYKLFYIAPRGGLRVFLGFSVVLIATAGLMFARMLWRHGISLRTAVLFSSVVLICAFPVWFELKQANMEIIIWALVTCGIACCLADRGYPAAACFGLAASMKIYPAAYLGLLLFRRQYRQVALGLATAVVATVGSLWLLGGTIGPAWAKVNEGVQLFRDEYMLHKRPEMVFDHSLFSIVKVLIHRLPGPAQFAPVLTIYLVIVGIAGTLMFFLRARKLPLTNQILFLSIACILFPPVSFEYTLLHLLAPLALLLLISVDHARSGGEGKIVGLCPALVCLAILLAPLSEMFIRSREVDGQIKSVTLAVLLVIALWRPFGQPLVARVGRVL